MTVRGRCMLVGLATAVLLTAGAAEALEFRPFIVYYHKDSSDLTVDAQSVLEEAVSWFKTEGCHSTIVVNGHADTHGSSGHNMALSRARAEGIVQAMLAAGLPRERIVVNYLGESQPAVATGDGVWEPLNRRVEIDYDIRSMQGCPPSPWRSQ